MSAERRDWSVTTAVVTGASSGIGAATAEALSRRGTRVVAVARRRERLEELASRCADQPGAIIPLAADLAELDRLDDIAVEVTSLIGCPDVLINNAGVPMRKQIAEITPTQLEQVMAINYFSPVRLTLAFLPAMRARGTGAVVNVSSMGPHIIAYGTGAYCASKAALEMFTEALYAELAGSGVGVHILIPGTTESEFSDDHPGNDAAMPAGPSGRTPSSVVAEAIVACVDEPGLRTYATAADADTAATKRADPNAFVDSITARLSAR